MKFLPTMNDIFDDLFYDPFKNYTTVNAMRTDITEQGDHYLLDMELPGFQKENIQLELKDGYLYISANRDENNEESDVNVIVAAAVVASMLEMFKKKISRHHLIMVN